ncbi:MAG: hypothetical protein JF888_02175 [Candidatus Dormibacteraeota bacterium]|uniref:Uncharacterized protein n=1 Tax=Candidatus Dormiibacter inghamiae TaxID=3127013 RepID=A0A934NCE6_9BACT|nr:hypothetical protein [Candidatus Dormibacteraeota bacterium]MBJ7605391.1 hypothetical protein [Candidatus Dormibacteraeota bacterium]
MFIGWTEALRDRASQVVVLKTLYCAVSGGSFVATLRLAFPINMAVS